MPRVRLRFGSFEAASSSTGGETSRGGKFPWLSILELADKQHVAYGQPRKLKGFLATLWIVLLRNGFEFHHPSLAANQILFGRT